MKTTSLLFSAAILFALQTGTAVAGPKNGFGLNAGLTSHTMDCNCLPDSSSGLSLGLDYQFALSDTFSISPFLMSSGESTNLSGVTAGHGILGVQLRFWAGDVFFGGHIGSYSEVLSANSVSISGSGGGAGLVAGWENPNGGMYWMGQLDSANIAYSGFPDYKLHGMRLSIGYRWK